MELRQLRSFSILAEELHYGRAAQRLNIVQPALSKQMKSLEDALGGALLLRNRRGVALTEAGRLFLVEAKLALEHARRAQEVVARAARGERGRVRLGYSASAIHAGVLSRAVALIEAARPEVEIVIDRVDPWQQTERLLSRAVDLVFGPDTAEALPPTLVADAIARLPVCVALASNHPLASRDAVDPADLAGETFVEYAANEPEARGVVERLLGLRPRLVLTENDTLTVLAVVEAGRGVSVLPSVMAQPHFPRVAYRPLTAPAQPLTIAMIHARAEPDPFRVSILALLTRALCEPDPRP